VLVDTVLFLASAVCVGGQACVPYRGSPATGGKCDRIVTFPNVLLPPATTYDEVRSGAKQANTNSAKWYAGFDDDDDDCVRCQADEQAANTTKLLGVFVPPVCRSAAIRLACLGSFVECSVSPTFSCAHTSSLPPPTLKV
jgi:hypothetical protein